MSKVSPLPNTSCLVKACEELHIPYHFYDQNHNLMRVQLDKEYFFANSSTPFNDESVSKICKDKEFLYLIAGKETHMPRSVGFLDPHVYPTSQHYLKYRTLDEIITEIEIQFSYPCIVKMNSGLHGIHVFKCANRDEVSNALKVIYDKTSPSYDYIALAQEYIPIAREYRAVAFHGEILLAYEKDFSKTDPNDSHISPLHKKNARAVIVSDATLLKTLAKQVRTLYDKVPVGFAGFDIVIDTSGNWWLLEVNTKPGFEYLVRDNGSLPLVTMYKRILSLCINSKTGATR